MGAPRRPLTGIVWFQRLLLLLLLPRLLLLQLLLLLLCSSLLYLLQHVKGRLWQLQQQTISL